MSFVGPRPELLHYVSFYEKDDHIVFSVRPGITSFASLKYLNEVEILKVSENPESFYTNTIIPDKIKLNKEYINKQNILLDLKLIMMTMIKIFIK